jgi:hypothetical protein
LRTKSVDASIPVIGLGRRPMPGEPAPRALLHRLTISIEVTPAELSALIEVLTAKAARAADDPQQIDFADFMFRRVAELREAFR